VTAGAAELRTLAVGVARAAGALVRERRAAGVSVAAIKSSDVDVVTEADRASEELVRRLLAEARPGDGFLGEEGHDDDGSTGVRWVVDPIDGTVNFLYGIPQYAVSVAAQRDGVSVAGAVLDVASGSVWSAERAVDGSAASWRDGVPTAVRAPAPLAQRLVGTGFSYEARVRALQAEAVGRLLPQVRDIRRFGSCALDLCGVASGLLDGYVEEGTHLWDHAAGSLVAEGAGARWELARGVGGGDLLVCAPAHGFDELWETVLACGFAAASDTV
jgi:myo-inositol-1(or 4)-monophosphatase